jgi:hypothetical protein
MYFSAKAKRTNPRYWRRNVTTASTIAWQIPPRRQVDFATSSDSNITGFLGRHNFARNRFLQLPTLLRRIYASWTSSFFSQIEDDTNVHKSTCPRLQLYFRSTRRRIPVSRQNLRSRKFRRLDRFEEAVPPLPAEGSL